MTPARPWPRSGASGSWTVAPAARRSSGGSTRPGWPRITWAYTRVSWCTMETTVAPVDPAQEVIRVGDHFYVLALSSRADDRTRVLKHGDTFAVLDRYGDILAD